MAKQLNVSLNFSADATQAKQTIQELNTMLTKIQTQPGKLFDDVELKKASQAAKDLQGHLQAAVNVDTGKLDLNKFSQSLSKSNQNLRTLYTDLNRIGPEGQAAFLKMAQSINAADNSALNLGNKLKNLGTTLANTARWQLSSSLLHGFMGAVQGALGYAQDLNESLNNIRIVTGQSVEQMEKFAAKANKAARELSATTTEYTNASLIFYQQGLSDEEVAKRTAVTIKMANAAGQSAEIVSDQLTAVWNNFYDGSKSLEYYADVMTALGAATASSTDEIAGGLEKFASIGQTIGLSYEYAASALATITANTRQSEDVVGTALKTIFARVQGLNLGETLDDGTTLNKYSEALQKVGISIFDSAGQLKKMDDILDEMGDKWGTLNKAQQTALAQTVAGTRQYTQLVALMDNWDKGDSDSMQANLSTAYGAEGALQDQADIYAESWEAARDRVSAAAEGIYQSLLDDDFFITILDGFESFLNGIKNVIDGLGGLKGILLLVGGIFMQHFAREIPKALNAVAQNFDVITGKAAANKQLTMDQNVSALNDLDVSGTTDSMNAEIQSITRVSEMSAELERQRKNLSATELAYYEGKIKHIEAYGAEAVAIGKENDELKKLIETKEASIAKKAVRSQDSDLSKLDEEIKKQEELVAAKKQAAEIITAEGQQVTDQKNSYISREVQAENAGNTTDYAIFREKHIEAAAKEAEYVGKIKVATDEVTAAEAKLAQMKEKRAKAGSSKGSEKEIRAQLKELEKVSIKYQTMQSALGKIQGQAKAWKEHAKEIKGNEKATEKMKESMVDYLNHLKEIGLGGKNMDEFIRKIKQGEISIEDATDALQKWNVEGDLIDTSGMDTFEQEIAEIEQKLRQLGVSQTDLDDLAAQFESGAITAEQYRQALDRLNKEAGEMPQHVMSASEGFGVFAGKAMQLMSAITSLQNLGNIWKDEDLSTGQKIMQTMSALIPVISLATTMTNAKAMADTKAAAQAILHAIGLGASTAAQAGETTGVWASVVAWIAKQAAMWPVLVVTLLLVAAVGILIGIFAGLSAIINAVSDAYNADAIAAENAENAAKNLGEAYNEVKQEYQDMISAMENYQSARDALDDLTKGTEEYREALKEANRQALELINQYGLVEGQDYEWQGDELVIKDEAMNRVRSAKEDEVDKAYAASQMAGAEAKRLRAKADLTEMKRDIRDDNGLGDGDLAWKTIGTSIATSLLPGIGPIIGGAIGGAYLSNEFSDAAKMDEAIEKAVEESKTNANLFDTKEAMAKALDIDLNDTELIDALWANRDSIQQLSADMNAATQAEKLAAQNAANEIMSESGYDKTESGQMALEAGGEIYQQMYGEAYDKYLADAKDRGWFNTGTDASKAAFEEYAKQAGLDQLKNFEVTNYKGDGTVEYKYIDENGDEQTKLATAEEIAATLAAADAANSLEGALSALRSKIDELNNSKNEADHALAEFISKGNLEGATKEEYDAIKEEIGDVTSDADIEAYLDKKFGDGKDGQISDETAKKYGYENADAMVAAMKASLEIEWEVPDGVADEIADKFTIGAAAKIQSAYEKMGEQGGQAFVDTVNTIASGADWEALTPDEQTAMLDEIANIDWTSWDAGEQAIAIAERYGVAIDGTTQAWQDNVNAMRDAANALPDLEAMRQEFEQIKEITADMDIGSILSEEDYETLVKYNSELSKYFTILSDGSAQFIGDKLDFQQEVEAKHSQDLLEAMQVYKDRNNEILAQIKAGEDAVGGAGKVDQYRDSENYVGADGNNYYSGANVDTQLDFLESQGYDSAQIATWREDLKDGSTYVATLEEIAGAVDKTADSFNALGAEAERNEALIQGMMNELALSAESAAERAELLESGLIDADAYGYAAMAAHNEEKWEGMDPEEVDDYADSLRNAAEASELLSDDLKDNEEAAEDVALYTKKMNKGIDALADGFEDWSDVLNKSDKSSEEYSDAMNGMKEAMSDVLGVSEEFLSDDFILQNMEDIKLAAEGDAAAIDRLAIAAAQDILVNVGFQDEGVKAEVMALHDELAAMVPDIQVGATLDDGDFLSKAAQVVETANMTVEEANAYFRALGFEPHFETKEVKTTVRKPKVRTHTDYAASVSNVSVAGLNIPVPTFDAIQTSWNEGYTEVDETIEVPSLTTDGGEPNFTLTRTNSGAMNNYSGSNSGGKSPGGKSGGGGGSNPSAPDKADKRDATNKSDIVERYRELNDAIDNVTDALTRAERATERLWGKDKLAAMREENKILEQQRDLILEKAKEAEKYAKEDAANLRKVADDIGVSVVIDQETGDITNVEDVENTLHERLAAAEAEYNAKVEAYNKYVDSIGDKPTEAQADQAQKMKDALDAYEEDVIGKIEKDIETWDNAEQQFQESVEAWEDAGLEAEEILDQIMQNNFDIIMEGLEIPLSLNEEDIRLVELKLSQIEDDFYNMAEGLALTTGQFDEYRDNLRLADEAMAELDRSLAAGEITEAAYQEGLATIRDTYYDNIEALMELDKTMEEYYSNTLDMANEELSKYTDQMEHQASVLEHYHSLIELMGKSSDYDMVGKVLEGQVKTSRDALDVSTEWYNKQRENADSLAAEYSAAQARGASEAELEIIRKNWEAAEASANEAQDKMLSDAEAWAESLKAVLENDLAKLGQTLENALTGGSSFDAMSQQWERAQSLQEEYLTTTNQIYETNKLMRTAQQEIDKTTNSAAKKRLKAYIEETEQLQNQSKLSQYELEIQQAKYDLLLAEMALEDAQDAKSTVRLQRDAEGNFGYVYTADTNKLAEAQQQLEDAQNSLYNIGLEGANDYAQKYQQTIQEMYDTYADIQQQKLDGAFETEEEYHRAMEEAKSYYYQKLQDYSGLYSTAVSADSRVVADAWSSDFASMVYDTDEWMQAVDEYAQGAIEAFQDWQSAVTGTNGVTTIVGSSVEEVGGKVQDVTDKSHQLAETTTKEVIPALDAELDAVQNMTGAYAAMRQEIQAVIEEYTNMVNRINNSQTNEWNNGDDGSSGGGSGDGSGGSGSGDGGSSGGDSGSNDGNGGSTGGGSGSGDGGSGDGTGDNSAETAELTWNRIMQAYDQIVAGKWGNGVANRVARGKDAGFTEEEVRAAQQYINYTFPRDRNGLGYSHDKAKGLMGFDTGGYTGDWAGSYGKLALLHKKELVLEPGDTENLLSSIEVLDHIIEMINLQSLSSQIGGLLSSPTFGYGSATETLEQNVHIEASFPGVQDRNEIEEAFNNLINKASQYANRK